MSLNRWEEAKEIQIRIDRLMKEAVWELEESYKEEVLSYFDEKCKESKASFEKRKEVIPMDYEHRKTLPTTFPIVFKKSQKSKLYDLDGNKYLNFNQGEGSLVIGGNNKEVIKTIEEAIKKTGINSNAYNESEIELTEKIRTYMPHMEMVKFFGGRTEATMAAIRLARVYTGKKKIIKFSGGNNGWYDDILLGNEIPGTKMMLNTFGLNRQALKFTKEVRANNISDMKKALAKKTMGGGIAAVIIEPIGADDGRIPLDYYYCKTIKELCEKNGVLLIFDESVTGFRLGEEGVSGYLGVKPDITILGNVVAGGLSGGAVGGRENVMKHFQGDQPKGKHRAYTGSPLDGNILSMSAGKEAIDEIVEKEACSKAASLGDMLADEINRIIHDEKLPFVAYNHGSIVHLEITGSRNFDVTSPFYFISLRKLYSKKMEIIKRKESLEMINAAFLSEGIILSEGRKFFVTSEMTTKDIEETLEKIKKVFSNLEKKDGKTRALEEKTEHADRVEEEKSDTVEEQVVSEETDNVEEKNDTVEDQALSEEIDNVEEKRS